MPDATDTNSTIKEIQLGATPIFGGEGSLQMMEKVLEGRSYSKIAILVDENTERYCLPKLAPFLPGEFQLLKVHSGESVKNLETCQRLWAEMMDARLDRKSLMINLGGGVIGDMGGFVAACFKRGIDFIQVPTTLLSQVDASVGGKTGVDFRGIKNQLGTFSEPLAVILEASFFETLPERELKSGFGEVLKHALIQDRPGWHMLSQLEDPGKIDAKMVWDSMMVKHRIVSEDPFEKGIRKALNFGHTVGHALESHFLQKGSGFHLLHGEAVAIGMVCEAWISTQRGLLKSEALDHIAQAISRLYGKVEIEADDITQLEPYVRHDKKNEENRILLTLLDGIGGVKLNQESSWEEIEASIRYYLSL